MNSRSCLNSNGGRLPLNRCLQTDISIPECGRYRYVNTSCGPDFTVRRLCDVLRCRNVLLVGDSITRLLHLALQSSHSESSEASWANHLSRHCPINASQGFRMCSSSLCPTGLQVDYLRSDHLHSMGHAPHNCEHWPELLSRRRYQVLILGTGHHLLKYTNISGRDRRADPVWYLERAKRLAAILQPWYSTDNDTQAVFVRPQWGTKTFSNKPGKPLAEPLGGPPGGVPGLNESFGWSSLYIDDAFSWPIIPMIGALTASVLREELGIPSVDPTRAFAMRQDCRVDPLHSTVDLFIKSTWWMLLNTLVARQHCGNSSVATFQ